MEKKNLILIVDDIPKNLQILGSILRNNNYDVAVATSGRQAIEIAKNSNPDIVLLDVMMPEMNGFEVCEILKKDCPELPVIFITAKTDIDEIVHGFEVGAVDYLTKPFNATELLIRLKTHLALKLSKDLLAQKNIELEALTENLKKVNDDKTEFLQIVSHDLKNPLASIMGYAELIQGFHKQFSDDKIENFSQQIIDVVKRMNDLITKLLDIEKIESGKIFFNNEKFDVCAILNDIVNDYTNKAKAKKIQLKYLNKVKEAFINTDKIAFQQIIDNLLSNAIKYTKPEKIVSVLVDVIGNNVLVKIKDEGPGFTEEDKCKMFKKFTKLSAVPTAGENSAGIGLAITKHLIEKMKADLYFETELGTGSTFEVIFEKV